MPLGLAQIGAISKSHPISLSRIHITRKEDKKMNSKEQANGTMEPEASTSGAAQANPAFAPAAPKKKGILIGVGLAVLVVLLAGAAFVGGRLLNGQGLPGLTSGGPQVITGPGGQHQSGSKPVIFSRPRNCRRRPRTSEACSIIARTTASSSVRETYK